MSFSPVLQKIPAICKVIWWIGMLPTESAQCANEWCWLSTQHMDAMYLFRIYSLVSCQWRQIYLHPSSVPSPLVQVWHFTALPAVDVLNVFCMWNYFCEAVHLVAPDTPPASPHQDHYFTPGGSEEELVGSRPLCSPAQRERERWGADSMWQRENAPITSVSITTIVLFSFRIKHHSSVLSHSRRRRDHNTPDLADISDKLFMNVYEMIRRPRKGLRDVT